MNPKIKLKALFLYAQKDHYIQEELEKYFKSNLTSEYLSQIQYQNIESLNISRFLNQLQHFRLYFYLMSMDLVTADFFNTGIPKKMVHLENLNRISIIPISFSEVPEQLNPFKNKTILPAIRKPIDDQHWPSYNYAYGTIFKELIPLLQQIQDRVTNLESNWKETQKEDNFQAYGSFLKAYPYSQYASEAKARQNDLLEASMWKAAKKTDTVRSYFDYIKDCPVKNQKRVFEAARCIREIEQSEKENWKDATENEDQLKLYYQYKNKFPEGQYYNEVWNKLTNDLKYYTTTHELQVHQLNSNYLDYYSYQNKNLQPHQLFALNTYLQHFNALCQDQEKELKRLGKIRFLHIYAIPVTLLLIMFVHLFFPYFFIGLQDRIQTILGIHWTVRIAALILTIRLGFGIYCGLFQMKEDKIYLKKAIEYLQDLAVLCKVFMNLHDQRTTRNLLEFARRIEEKTMKIKVKGFWQYLYATRLKRQHVEELPINF